MSEYDDMIAKMQNSHGLHTVIERVEARVSTAVKEAMLRPEVQEEIDRRVEQKVEITAERIAKKKADNLFEAWLRGWLNDCVHEDEIRTRGLVSIICAIFPEKADHDRLLKKFGVWEEWIIWRRRHTMPTVRDWIDHYKGLRPHIRDEIRKSFELLYRDSLIRKSYGIDLENHKYAIDMAESELKREQS